MTKAPVFIGFILFLSLAANPLMADDSAKDSPWETFGFNAGVFFAYSTTDLRFGSGIGVSLNVEDSLGLSSGNSVFRMDGFWRFSDNRRHKVDLSWFSLNRTGTRITTEEFIIEPPDGEDIPIPIGSEVTSYFDLDIYQLTYSYSFLQDSRMDLAGQFGLYIMPVSFGLSVPDLVNEEADQSFTAPLPVFGLKIDVLIAPKWYFRSGSQIFYVKYEDFTGSLINLRSAVEYNPWKHVGFGLGFDILRMSLEDDGEEGYPGIDLRGNVQFDYSGIMLYGKLFF